MISIMTVRRLIKKGCSVYLTHVRELEKSWDVDKILVAGEFPDVFLEELPGLPPVMEVEVLIETLPYMAPIAQSPNICHLLSWLN